jgi:hypothetical protein
MVFAANVEPELLQPLPDRIPFTPLPAFEMANK